MQINKLCILSKNSWDLARVPRRMGSPCEEQTKKFKLYNMYTYSYSVFGPIINKAVNFSRGIILFRFSDRKNNVGDILDSHFSFLLSKTLNKAKGCSFFDNCGFVKIFLVLKELCFNFFLFINILLRNT